MRVNQAIVKVSEISGMPNSRIRFSVHLKIHVPDIIKHHIHTKTIFVHHHHGGGKKTVPKKKHVPKKETHHEEGHHEDWSSWSSYDFHNGHGDEHHGAKGMKPSGKGHMHGKMPTPHGHSGHYEDYGHGYDPRARPYGDVQSGHNSQYNQGFDHPVPPQQDPSAPSGYGGSGPGGSVGYSYPPQYGVHEDVEEIKHVKEMPNEIYEPYKEVFEEGYRKGLHSQTAHVLTQDLKNFYDNKFEEGALNHNGYDDNTFENYKNVGELKNNDASADDHGGYNYQDGDDYHSSVTDSR